MKKFTDYLDEVGEGKRAETAYYGVLTLIAVLVWAIAAYIAYGDSEAITEAQRKWGEVASWVILPVAVVLALNTAIAWVGEYTRDWRDEAGEQRDIPDPKKEKGG